MWCHCSTWCRTTPSTRPPRPTPTKSPGSTSPSVRDMSSTAGPGGGATRAIARLCPERSSVKLAPAHRARRFSPSTSSAVVDGVELDPVHERVVVDGAGVRGAGAHGLEVGLTAPPDVGRGDGAERHQLHLVDLDRAGSDPVAAPDLRLRPRPESVRERDRAVEHRVPQLGAEVHACD